MSEIFKVLKKDPKSSARTGRLKLAHGIVNTPVFMPVGTRGFVKTLTTEELKELGASIVLANAYHLYLRPGHKEVKKRGGINKFMRWSGPILTDSGGFQVFSLAHKTKLTDEGVHFQSVYDGSKHFVTPEDMMDIECAIGADIIMALDECVPYPVEHKKAEKALIRTIDWTKRAQKRLKAKRVKDQVLFAITQGSTFKDLRRKSTEMTAELDLPGNAIGGLSVGEPKEEMLEMLHLTNEILPKDKPRYLMGVGDPESLLEAVALGVDMFDCVHPTRIARNGTYFSRSGRFNLKLAASRDDDGPLDKKCACYVCQNYSKSYLRHMFVLGEMLALRLLSYHNLHFMIDLTNDIKKAIAAGDYLKFRAKFLKDYRS